MNKNKPIGSLQREESLVLKIGSCKHCKHWERQKPKVKYCEVGFCHKLYSYYFNYYDLIITAMKQMEKGGILSDNLYTHEDFGCIHFKKI